MPYVHITEEQNQANAADLPEFLRFKWEPLTRSGRELRLESNYSVTVRSNESLLSAPHWHSWIRKAIR